MGLGKILNPKVQNTQSDPLIYLGDGGLDMKVDYALDMNQEHVADCYLAIKAQPKDCKNFTNFRVISDAMQSILQSD